MAEGNYTTALLIDKPLFVHGHGAVLNAPPGANQTAIRLESGADLQVFGLSIINANVEGVGLRCQPAQTSSLPALTLDGVAIDSTNSTVVAQGCSATIVRGRLRTRKSTSPAVLVAPTSTMLIDRSILDGGDGVWGEGANSVVRITNSVIKNQTGSDGAFIGSDLFGAGAGSVVVSFSTVINSQVKCGSGVPRCAGGTAAGSCIENTIIYNALPNAPTDTVQPGGCTASYSLIYPQSTPVPGNENKLGVNPQFADFAAGDYHLTSTSSAIDAADPGANNMVDFDGTSRPQGTRSDIGAFEYKP